MGKKINKNKAQKDKVLEAIAAGVAEGVIEEKKKVEEAPVEQLSAFQQRDRNERTAFVGNVPVDATSKQLKKFFVQKEFAVEKVWFRSICTNQDSKKPERAKIIAGNINKAQKDNKNGYVLFEDKAAVAKACKALNQEVFQGHHIRVDASSGADRTAKRRANEDVEMEVGGNDFNTTVFIGNLPFIAGEEEVRGHFEECGQIENVRIVRDPRTFLGKGIGYIMFTEKEACRKAVDNLNGSKFKGRELRVKKAVDPKRLEKKQRKKMEKLRKDKHGSDSEDIPENFEIDSEDSEDEKKPKKKELTFQPDFTNLSRPTSNNQELRVENIIAFNKRKRQNMLKGMIDNIETGGRTKLAEQGVHTTRQNKALFKDPVRLSAITKKRIEARQKTNTAKYNSIQGKFKGKKDGPVKTSEWKKEGGKTQDSKKSRWVRNEDGKATRPEKKERVVKAGDRPPKSRVPAKVAEKA